MVEPVGGPDAVELPSEALEVVLAEAVPVSGGLRRVVHRPVGFDRQHVAPGLGGVLDGKVDPEP